MERDFKKSISQYLQIHPWIVGLPPFRFLFLLIFVSISFANGEPNCAPFRFNCGDIHNISYPFWKEGHQLNCSQPEFKLKCEDGTPKINIGSRTYRVNKIDYENQKLRVVDMDFIGKKCPQPSINATIDFSLFDYAPGDVNLTLYYDCPHSIDIPNYFALSCLEGNGIHAYYIIEDGPVHFAEHFRSCNVSVIPLHESIVDRLRANLWAYVEEGFDLKWTVDLVKCMDCVQSGDDKTNRTSRSKIIIAIYSGSACILLTCLCCCFFRHNSLRSSRQIFSLDGPIFFWKKKAKDAYDVEAFLEKYGSSVLKRYQYSDLKKMTDSFKDKLGEGGYGGVFKGKLFDGRQVAVKVLNKIKGNGEEFINEVASIGRTYHVNIVTLLGFCYEGTKRALIYEFMPNGSLERFIYTEKPRTMHPLGWKKLCEIALGIARGLEYLHRGCSMRILHFDIKPHNILLDQDFCPKISDFGLAKLCPTKESIVSMLGARGTFGYIAPEVYCRNFGGVSYKSDVYSYGMVLLEMVGGRQNLNVGVKNTSEIYFPQWIYKRLDQHGDLALHEITTEVEEETARKMIVVGLWCIQTDPTNRPSMGRVVEMLEGSLTSLPMPPNPFLSSPSKPDQASSTT